MFIPHINNEELSKKQLKSNIRYLNQVLKRYRVYIKWLRIYTAYGTDIVSSIRLRNKENCQRAFLEFEDKENSFTIMVINFESPGLDNVPFIAFTKEQSPIVNVFALQQEEQYNFDIRVYEGNYEYRLELILVEGGEKGEELPEKSED